MMHGALTFLVLTGSRLVAASAIALALAFVLAHLAAPVATEGQPAGKLYRIGFLQVAPRTDVGRQVFEDGLRSLGWVVGRNIVIEHRSAEGNLDRVPELAAELVRLQPDVIVTATNPNTIAVRKLTATIPLIGSRAARA